MSKKTFLSKKPSLARAPRFKEAEKIIKERKKELNTTDKTAKKSPPKKTAAKKSPAKKGKKDPMWKNLAKAMKDTLS
ncbi:MAG: hypothetical protein LBU88_01875 [Treponema sp.]|jgi:hypothetical protein|nr:hypothetical protein [Treponema sp.]